MTRLRIAGLALIAALALSAVAATGASAAEYIYKVNGAKLEATITKGISAKAKTPFVLKGEIIGLKSITTCNKLKLAATEPAPVIIGGTPGTSEERIVFEECSGSLGGSGCKSVTVENTPALNEVVTVVLPAAKVGKLATLFTPKAGTLFTTIKLKECGIFGSTEGKVEGTSASLNSEGESVVQNATWVAGAEEITKVKKASGAEVTVGLKFGGNPATLEGVSEVELTSKEKWGTF
jgi:hypothetical protein